MSESVVSPTLRRLLDGLERRLAVLERRVRPDSPAAGGKPTHTHDGTGLVSTVVPLAAQSPTASGDGSTAMGADAVASNEGTVAVGSGAAATHFESAAFGPYTETLVDNQVVVGRADLGVGHPAPWVVLAAPAAAIADASLGPSQLCFYYDSGSSTLIVKVKYKNGTTIKTGTVTLT